MEYSKQREDVACFMKRLYKQKLITTSGGNISSRFEDKVLITPSQLDKGSIKPEEIGLITMEGKNLTPHLKLSMESKMHLAIYKQRQDVNAIIHAHPVYATAFSISKNEIITNISGESWAILGNIVKAQYALMGSERLAENVANASINANCILLENHGALTVGENLLISYDRMEVLEATAKMNFITKMLGERRELNACELEEINALMNKE